MDIPAFMLDAEQKQKEYALHRAAWSQAYFQAELERQQQKEQEEAQAWLDLDAAKNTTD